MRGQKGQAPARTRTTILMPPSLRRFPVDEGTGRWGHVDLLLNSPMYRLLAWVFAASLRAFPTMRDEGTEGLQARSPADLCGLSGFPDDEGTEGHDPGSAWFITSCSLLRDFPQ